MVQLRVIASVTELQPLIFSAWHPALQVAALSLETGLAYTTKTDMSGLYSLLRGTRLIQYEKLVFILRHELGNCPSDRNFPKNVIPGDKPVHHLSIFLSVLLIPLPFHCMKTSIPKERYYILLQVHHRCSFMLNIIDTVLKSPN